MLLDSKPKILVDSARVPLIFQIEVLDVSNTHWERKDIDFLYFEQMIFFGTSKRKWNRSMIQKVIIKYWWKKETSISTRFLSHTEMVFRYFFETLSHRWKKNLHFFFFFFFIFTSSRIFHLEWQTMKCCLFFFFRYG